MRISDGDHEFPFLFKGRKLYWPDYNPEAFGKHPDYRLAWGPRPDTLVDFAIIRPQETCGCVPFRLDGYRYSQYSNVDFQPKDSILQYYMELQAYKDGDPDPDYTSVQGMVSQELETLRIWIRPDLYSNGGPWIQMKTNQPYQEYLQGLFPGHQVQVDFEMALTDENDIYWHSTQAQPAAADTIWFILQDWGFGKNFEFLPGLRFQGILKATMTDNSGHQFNMDLRSEPLALTEDLYAALLAKAQNINTEILPDDMKIISPRIMEKTIQKVVTMTSQTDSKANIIQPVFFRARELAHILIHPEVTENISINLDAYKSQVTQFYIKVEGVAFPEIGRTEGGVIFKVQGSLLPGSKTAGTYYILNERAELITTGKYTYES